MVTTKSLLVALGMTALMTFQAAGYAEEEDNNFHFKIRARIDEGITVVKILMSHPMETGYRTDHTNGEIIPAHYITELFAKHNGRVVYAIYPTGWVSKNPYFSFKFSGAQEGEAVELYAIDNLGNWNSGSSAIE